MKNVLEYSMKFFMLFVCLISCSTSNKMAKVNSIKNFITDYSFSSPPVYYQKYDTPQNRFLSTEKLKINQIAQPYQNIDTLINRNLELQRIAIRVIDRAYLYRINNDSLKSSIADIRKAQILSDRKADAYYNAAKKSNYYAEQNKNYVVAINWQQWIAFATILIFLLGNTYLLNKIKKHQPNTL